VLGTVRPELSRPQAQTTNVRVMPRHGRMLWPKGAETQQDAGCWGTRWGQKYLRFNWHITDITLY
jgi:hypothetical protein